MFDGFNVPQIAMAERVSVGGFSAFPRHRSDSARSFGHELISARNHFGQDETISVVFLVACGSPCCIAC